MLLYTCGCSFTYGEELDNKQNAWPHKLAKKLSIDNVINTATCSASNEYITRNVINFITHNKNKDIFVVLGWTSDIRWEGYIDKPIQTYVQLKINRHVQYTHKKDYRIYTQNEVNSMIPNFIQKEYNNISNDFLLCFKSNNLVNYYTKQQQILMMHCFLEQYNIKHLFFNSLIELFIKEQSQSVETIRLSKNIKNVEDEIIDKTYYIKNPTMEEYTKQYPLAPLKHPLEEGHAAWAEYLYLHIKEKNIL
jgi:hypothetical protein